MSKLIHAALCVGLAAASTFAAVPGASEWWPEPVDEILVGPVHVVDALDVDGTSSNGAGLLASGTGLLADGTRLSHGDPMAVGTSMVVGALENFGSQTVLLVDREGRMVPLGPGRAVAIATSVTRGDATTVFVAGPVPSAVYGMQSNQPVEPIGVFKFKCTCRCGEGAPLKPVDEDDMAKCINLNGTTCVNSEGEEDEFSDCKKRWIEVDD